MRIFFIGLRVALVVLTAAAGAGAERPAETTPHRLTFRELERRGLLDESQIWVARNLRTREPLGVSLDLRGDGTLSTVVAGIRTSKIPNSGLEDLSGFVRIFEGDKAMSVDWEFPGHYLSELLTFKSEDGPRRQVMAVFADAGSTFGFSLNVFVFATENGFGSVSLPSVGGGLQVEDLDGDGRDEVIFQSYFEPDRVSPPILWRDVLRWTGLGFLKANEEYGAFYRGQIEGYYRENVERAKRLKLPESYIAGNLRAIGQAEKLASKQ